MSLSSAAAQKCLIAFQRFGLGPKPGGFARIGADPQGALHAEVETANIADINKKTLASYNHACAQAQKGFGNAEDMRRDEMNARIDKQMDVEIGFVERLVIFFSNHFSMTVNKDDEVRGTLGQWERDVIRKNVLGKFSKMLNGTIEHPAMISYLDNEDSIGPNSPAGQQWGAGFNENLGRELMELHTIGSGGGYTQDDVMALANILTGWSYVRGWEADGGYNGGNDNNRGRFVYRSTWHEPGPITLMGKSYAALGQKQAQDVLADLAAHPATAEHIAFKLARHFITDEPTPAMVTPLQQKFASTGGNLKAVAHALIDLPESWSTPLNKIKTPYEYSIAHYRALGKRYKNGDTWVLSEPLYALHQMAWESPSPEGYSDETPTWLNPDAMRIRLDLANFSSWEFARDYKHKVSNLARSLFDSALSQTTRDKIAAAETSGNWGANNDALTVLLSSPEMQRR